MMAWWSGKPGGFLAFVAIAGLLVGGLAWTTASALRLEREQLDERGAAVHAVRLRLALGRLDGRVAPLLAREDARPFNHYSTLYPPPLALSNAGTQCAPGTVLEPSPLLHVPLPPWMLLHFQVDASPDGGWASPQVPSPELLRLKDAKAFVSLPDVTAARTLLLRDLANNVPPADLLATVHKHAGPATLRDSTLRLARRDADVANFLSSLANNVTPQQRSGNVPANPEQTNSSDSPTQEVANSQQRTRRDLAYNTISKKGYEQLARTPPTGAAREEVTVSLTPMIPVWLRPTDSPERLIFARLVNLDNLEVCQGMLLDADAVRQLLKEEIADLFPQATILPSYETGPAESESAMATLPFRLVTDADDSPVEGPGWTPLRVGLLLAWAAALTALGAVGLGGWSLLNLSERRARFVSAVTHELRTPLTTLRLYLDMLVGGMVRDPVRREEYLRTLNSEAERLHRLVANVLDFARLERQQPRPVRENVPVAELLERVRETWQRHCEESGKELVAETVPADATICTDVKLVEQVLGNLIDNACKYSRGADDRRISLRFRAESCRALFEVEDRGPGVPVRERRAIFRAFRRGRTTEATAGGVGLGLALARQWVQVLGGRLVLAPGLTGACFRVELPVTKAT